jgi:SAM-dependent methyltransferase
MAEYIHGSSDEREVARLEKQARFIAPLVLNDFDVPEHGRVLDLATGVGAMAEQLRMRFPHATLIGADLRMSQLQHARKNHPSVAYVQANGAHLPFPDETFDRVHCSWLLEHVPTPVEILKDVRRVLRPGGYCQFVEVDNSTFQTEPEYSEIVETLQRMNDAQIRGGGNPFIGQKLGDLLREAGFSEVKTGSARMVGTSADMAFFHAFAHEFAEIFESLDEALGQEARPLWTKAAERLRELPTVPGSRMEYKSVIGRGTR